MSYIVADSQPELLNKLSETLRLHISEPKVLGLNDFIKRFFSVVSFEELLATPEDDVIGSALGFWQFLCQHDLRLPTVRVFNPEFEHHGWRSTHTVIQISCPDRPFIVDSVRIKLNEIASTVHQLQNVVFDAELSPKGELVELFAEEVDAENSTPLAFVYFEIDRLATREEAEALQHELEAVLGTVEKIVNDYPQINNRLHGLLAELDSSAHADVLETQAFLRWLLKNNFTFLGYAEVEIKASAKALRFNDVSDSALGLFGGDGGSPYLDYAESLNSLCESEGRLKSISISKAPVRSTVHRPAYPDCLQVRTYDKTSKLIKETRILGLFTSPVYIEDPRRIPMLRKKVDTVVSRASFARNSHHGKGLQQVLAVFPRDELFHMGSEQLFETAMDILHIQERRRIRVYIRRDPTGQFASCLVYVPRDIYSTDLRIKMQDILVNGLHANDAEFTTQFSESVLCRVHFTLRLKPNAKKDFNLRVIREEIIQAASSWADEFKDAILEARGEVKGNRLISQYSEGFSLSYKERFSPRAAVVDVEHMISVSTENPLVMSFYQNLGGADGLLHFKVYHHQKRLPLSELIPIVENLGLKVISEFTYNVRRQQDDVVCIHDFILDFGTAKVDLQKANTIFQDALREIWFGKAENDLFNRLVLAAYMDWRQVSVLRSYARYLKQVRFGFSQEYIAETLIKHIEITRLIYKLFEARFDPKHRSNDREALQGKLESQIAALLDEVSVLNEDRILRHYISLIMATLRSNFYQLDEAGKAKNYISFKLSTRDIPEVPQPCPMFEIFVYSPQVEGVHLRGGKVARGGLRWSDRLEDYRTEVLGLVKAQQVKNAVIVPVGAKGGFVAKATNAQMDRETFMAEGIAAYRIFIQALLDVTDNLSEGKTLRPESVLCYDEEDPYLVVAADKGTASFSDIANGIAADYGFWLGDAFASGGSVGYDHKKMGITARGAWVSVQRHFRELGVNVQEDTVSVVGIGDMAGDVFGNGMLLSDKLAMVAAFNHMHIFIDPQPNVAESFVERQRLFDLPRSSWKDYNAKLISSGGGVFLRSAKSIAISKEMKARFDISKNRLTPNELITALLKAPVDLIWNGGIGTYIKSSHESHADVGDKANDALRVNGCELRCKVLGEGGNLGASQLGRVEFGLNQGKSNTDFIDNAGGVDCSDHEVNIKILLNEVVDAGDMTNKQRNKLLESMTSEVSELVLLNNYRQVGAISMAEMHALDKMDELKRFINHLEQAGRLDRAIEYLPDNEALNERIANNQGLSRAELSLLISYAKSDLKEKLLDSTVPDDEYMAREIETAFPAVLVKRYPQQVKGHRLRREIIATQVANHLINTMGITFIYRTEQATGASAADIAKAFVVARDVFNIDNYWQQVEALDHQVDAALQQEMLLTLMRLVQRATRWIVRMKRNDLDPRVCVDHYRPPVGEYIQVFTELLNEAQNEEWDQRSARLTEANVPTELARFIAGFRSLSSSLSITHAADLTQLPIKQVGTMFFALSERLGLHWFVSEIQKLQASNHWQTMAKDGVRDEINWQIRALTVAILGRQEGGDCGSQLDSWALEYASMLKRWDELLAELRSQGSNELAMFTVASRELVDLVQASQ